MSCYVKLKCETCDRRTIVDDEELSCIADAGDFVQFFCDGCYEPRPHHVVGNEPGAIASYRHSK